MVPMSPLFFPRARRSKQPIVLLTARPSACVRLDRKIDARTLHSGKIDTNADTTFATIGVDRRLPTVRREGKSRTRQFLRHIMQRFVQPDSI